MPLSKAPALTCASRQQESLLVQLTCGVGVEDIGLPPEAFSLLMDHDFPGNVREIQNIHEHAFVLCHSGLIQPRHLPPYLRREPIADPSTTMEAMNLKTREKMSILEALRKHGGNRALAARDLGINPSTLYRKIKALPMEVPEKDGRSQERRKGGLGGHTTDES